MSWHKKSPLRWAGWVLLVVAVATMLATAVVGQSDSRSNAERVEDISRTIACPQCVGQSVAQSDVAIAREIRTEISRLVTQGQTDDQIRGLFADRYGDWVVLTPSGTGVNSLVWIIPVVGLLVGIGVLGLALARWRREAAEVALATDADRTLVATERRSEHLP